MNLPSPHAFDDVDRATRPAGGGEEDGKEQWQAQQGCALEGGEDAGHERTVEVGKVEGWLHARQGLTERSRAGRPPELWRPPSPIAKVVAARHTGPCLRSVYQHYDRARGKLDRHAVHFLTAYVAGV